MERIVSGLISFICLYNSVVFPFVIAVYFSS
jgi:hypothetical protein